MSPMRRALPAQDGPTLQHLNFHTWQRRPVFEHDPYDQMMRRCLPAVLAGRGIVCPVWEVMPTHLHLIVATFADLPCSTIVKHVKGDTARAFFAAFPALRVDLGGSHLWQKGCYAASITSHRQYLSTEHYIRANRANAGLLPPAPLGPVAEA